MKKFLLPFFLLLFLALSVCYKSLIVKADELDDVTKKLNDLNSALNQSISATKPLESQLTSMQQQIAGIKAQVSGIEVDIAQKKKDIDRGYVDLAKKELLFNEAVKNFYIQSSYDSPLLIFFSAKNAEQMTQELAYQKATTDQNKAIITNIALSITDLEQKKAVLEDEQKRLVAVKTSLDEQSAKLDKIVQGAKAYQASLSGQIAQLSARQQQLIAEKQASLHLPTSAETTSGGCSSDLDNGKDPGFSPKFALFSLGVPHRVGMNQYGAKGRAQAGQSATQILQAYFNNIQLTTVSTSTNIHVTGTNEYGQSFDTNWDIETYVKHIYEMPTNWPAEALKAQAIAARSYALATTNNGANPICPSQSCQVVKQELNSQAWIDAVNATAGQVASYNGQPIKAWFSSTAGGYFHSSASVGWNATGYTKDGLDASGSVSSFSDLRNNAYDKESPWFYCDWGGRSQYAGTAWLKPEELADIVNVMLLSKADNSTISHLSQTDKNEPDTWSADQVKQELKNRNITPFNSISGASVDADFGSGVTTTIHFSGDAGSQSFSGSDFKTYFNLRAPSNINIVGPLYNIEVR